MINISKKGDKFWINGRGFLIQNWEFHKEINTFSNEEIKAFENYKKTLQ
jgi:hypothetical protein